MVSFSSYFYLWFVQIVRGDWLTCGATVKIGIIVNLPNSNWRKSEFEMPLIYSKMPNRILQTPCGSGQTTVITCLDWLLSFPLATQSLGGEIVSILFRGITTFAGIFFGNDMGLNCGSPSGTGWGWSAPRCSTSTASRCSATTSGRSLPSSDPSGLTQMRGPMD